MKVLLLNLWRVIDSKGGTEKVFFNMANELTKRGYEVVALGLHNKEGSPSYYVEPNVKFINVGVGYSDKKTFGEKIKRILCGTRESRRNFDEVLKDYKKSELLKPVIEKEKPDIIICFNVEATRILHFNINVDIPVITMFHFDPYTILKNATRRTIKALEKCICIQCLLPSYINITKQYVNHNNIVSIGNVVPDIMCLMEGKKENIIVNVGRFEQKQKRQDIVIKAFNLIKKQFPEWHIEFWGELNISKDTIKYANYCKSLVKHYGLEKQISFCGTSENIVDVLDRAAIFALPSSYEGFSLAQTEAMSAGLPVVGFKNALGVNGVINDGSNGVLVEESIEDFANGLAELMTDADKRRRYGLKAKEDMKQYSSEKIYNQWEKLICKSICDYNNVENK